MRASKIVTLLMVGLLVFGSAGFFGYTLFLKPYTTFSLFSKKKGEVNPKKVILDPSLAAFDAAVALQKAGKLAEAQAAWQTWLASYPEAPQKREALILLGKANMELLCSSATSDQKENYTVIKGDSLDRIARKQKSNPELIQRLNNLPNINLQIGEILFVPQLSTTLEIDRQTGLLILRNHDQFLKSYVLLSFPPVGPQPKPAQATTIVDRIATFGNKRTAFGDKKYPDSERIILLRSCGNIVAAPALSPSPTAAPDTANISTTNAPTPAMPPGFVISTADMKEIFPFITKETPVTIH